MKRWLPLLSVSSGLLLTGCLAVGPGIPYRDGQVVDLSITQFNPGDTVWLSECAPAQTPSVATGCGTTLHGQPTVRLDSRGTGSGHFTVASTVAGIGCAGWCTIVATNGSKLQTVPVPFASTGSVQIATLDMSQPHDIYVNGKFFHQTHIPRDGVTIVQGAPGSYRIDNYLSADLPGGAPLASTTVKMEAGKGYGMVLYPTSNTQWGLAVDRLPPPPAPGRVRVRFYNATPITVTPPLGSLTGTPIAPGQGTTMILTGPSNVPDGQDTWGGTYPASPGSSTICGSAINSAQLYRGQGHLLTLLTFPSGVTGACKYPIGAIQEDYTP